MNKSVFDNNTEAERLKTCKYNYEMNNVYFGENFYVKDGIMHELNKNSQIMMDYFVFDMHDMILYNPAGIKDGFIAAFQEAIKGKKLLPISTNEGDKTRKTLATTDGSCVIEVLGGKIISVALQNVTEIGDEFLSWNETLSELSLPEVKKIGDWFLYNNNTLSELSLPKVE